MYRKVNTFVPIDILSVPVQVGCNFLKNTRRNSTFRAKALLWEASGRTKDLRSKRRISPCILQVVPSLPTKVCYSQLGPPDSLVAPHVPTCKPNLFHCQELQILLLKPNTSILLQNFVCWLGARSHFFNSLLNNHINKSLAKSQNRT